MGFLLLPFLAVPVGMVHEWLERTSNPETYANIQDVPWWLTALAWLVGSAFYGSIFLGIPAVVANLIRLPLMRLLFDSCQYNGYGIGVAMVGTFVIYELPVGLIVMMGPTKNIMYNYPAWLVFSVVSLPWLLSSLWSTWSLRQELLIPTEETGAC